MIHGDDRMTKLRMDKRISVSLPPQLYDRFSKILERNEMTASEVGRDAIRKYCEEKEVPA